jgi:hypothetical protein
VEGVGVGAGVAEEETPDEDLEADAEDEAPDELLLADELALLDAEFDAL